MDSFLGWWLEFRFKIKSYFIPFWVVLAVVSGAILIFSAMKVEDNPLTVHVLEFVFTFSFNIIFLYELVRVPAEEQMSCLVAYPVFFSMLAFGIFVVCIRVVPYFSAMRPWYVSFELAIQQRSWMSFSWALISMFSGFVVLLLTFWVLSKARFGDFIRPMLGFFIISIVTNALINFFLYYTNY